MIKYTVRFIVLSIVFMAISCVETPVSTGLAQKISFNASSPSAKTVLVDRTEVYWQNGDEISVSGAAEAFVTSLEQDSPSAVFDGYVAPSDEYYAIYPYAAVREWSEDLALVTLSQSQQATKGSFDPMADITAAATSDQDRDFYFRHVIGCLKFTIGADSPDITSVQVTSNSGDVLSGDFYISCSDLETAAHQDAFKSVSLISEEVLEEGDYYIALLPGTYAEGLTFTFTGPEGVAVKTVSKPMTLERGCINNLGVVPTLQWLQPEQEKAYYAAVAQTYDDWSGEYLITYSTSSSIKVFNNFADTDKGSSSIDLSSCLTSEGIPAESGDPYKATILKVGDNYSINITGVGFIGLESSSNKIHKSSAAPDQSTAKYLWKITYKSGGSVWLTNVAYSSRRLQWNTSANCFRCYEGGQEDLTLYKRTRVSGGSVPTPEPTPDPEPEPEPEPDEPTPDPEIPAVPSGPSGKYGWYELPVINMSQSGDYLVDSNNPDLYYAHHLCAGGEKGPGGKKARNYTVCFSAQHHCPVWVAAPRHKMYQSGASRTDAYAKDPDIPSDIQYNSKNTGGGCNKGHMLGSAERLSSTATNKQVFYYSNIAPQYSDTFNTGGGGWNTLEDWVDGQVCSDTLYVVIGAYFDKYTDKQGYTGNPAKISFGGRSDVSRPTMFYYILMRTKSGSSGKPLSQCTTSEIKCAAFVRSHEIPKGTKVSAREMMSVSELEKVTGFTYFPNVPQAPKDTYTASDWGL